MTATGPAESEDYRQSLLTIAQAVAPGWERQRARIEVAAAPVREWMIQALAPRPGDTVLELAAGAGDTGFEAASLVGERVRLISTDISAAMVEVSRRRGAELGLENVDYRVMDAERLELDADSVEGVICRFGYMLMADPAGAVTETRRVLRPDRRVVLSVSGAPEDNPWLTTIARTLVGHGHAPPPEPDAPGPFSLANEYQLETLIEEAGFTAARIEHVPVRFTFRDIVDYLAYATDTAGPFALVIQGLSRGNRHALEADLAAAFAPFATDGAYHLPGVALAAAAS